MRLDLSQGPGAGGGESSADVSAPIPAQPEEESRMQASGPTPSTCKRESCRFSPREGPAAPHPALASLLPFPQAPQIQHCDIPLNPCTCQLGRETH